MRRHSSLSTAAKIRNLIAWYSDDQIFTTRELLHMGKRNAIDIALYKMVRAGQITRLARGMFVKNIRDLDDFSIAVIAAVKARAFGKFIQRCGAYAALQAGLVDKIKNEEGEFLFYTSGCSSSFRFDQYTIRFISACTRKREIPDNEAGKLLKAFWHFGKRVPKRIENRAITLSAKLKGSDMKAFRTYIKNMPNRILRTFYPAIA